MDLITIPTDGLSPQETKTVQSIQKALNDARKGLATTDEVMGFIDDKVKDDKAALAVAQTELKSVKSEAAEVKVLADQMQSQIRRMMANGYASIKGTGGRYNGQFGGPEEAKMFGLMLMHHAMSNCQRADLAVMRDRVGKAIEKSGHEVIYVEDLTGKRIEKASTTGSQASGSLLMTTEMFPSLIMMAEEYGVFEADAAQVPMGAGSTLQPKMSGLMTLYCPGEGVAPTVTDPTIGAITMTAREILGLIAYSLALDEDSAIALAELYGPWIMRSYAYYTDLIGFLGDGTSTFFGMRGIAGALRAVDATIGNIKSVVVGTGNAYDELVYGDFEKMAGKLPDYADNDRTRMYMHKYFYYTVFVRAALAAGTGHAQEIILGTAQRQKLAMGYPVRFVQVMPKAEANSQHCATLGDLSMACQFGKRGALEIAQSDQRFFDQGLDRKSVV